MVGRAKLRKNCRTVVLTVSSTVNPAKSYVATTVHSTMLACPQISVLRPFTFGCTTLVVDVAAGSSQFVPCRSVRCPNWDSFFQLRAPTISQLLLLLFLFVFWITIRRIKAWPFGQILPVLLSWFKGSLKWLPIRHFVSETVGLTFLGSWWKRSFWVVILSRIQSNYKVT